MYMIVITHEQNSFLSLNIKEEDHTTRSHHLKDIMDIAIPMVMVPVGSVGNLGIPQRHADMGNIYSAISVDNMDTNSNITTSTRMKAKKRQPPTLMMNIKTKPSLQNQVLCHLVILMILVII